MSVPTSIRPRSASMAISHKEMSQQPSSPAASARSIVSRAVFVRRSGTSASNTTAHVSRMIIDRFPRLAHGRLDIPHARLRA
jgi:hypothetical protein